MAEATQDPGGSPALDGGYASSDDGLDMSALGEIATNQALLLQNLSQLNAALGDLGTIVLPLARGGTGASLTAPAGDRIFFYDFSASSTDWLEASTGLAITGTLLAVDMLGLQDLTDPGADRIFFWDDGAGASEWLTPTNGLEISGTDLQMTAAQRTGALEFVMGSGVATISTGIQGDLYVPFACTLSEWTLLGDQSGDLVVDIWVDSYANFPPTVADTITASAKPTISSSDKGQSSALTGWTTSIPAGSIMRFNVDSVTSIQRATLALTFLKG